MRPQVGPTLGCRALATELKTLRLCFLLLLAVLLPLRGAVAAAMLCPVGSSGMQSELRVQGHPVGHDMAGGAMAHDHGAAHDQDHDLDHDHAGSDRCNMCSAFCALTPLLSALPALLEPLDLTAVEFSDHAAPAPDFFSDGQERPPRTL